MTCEAECFSYAECFCDFCVQVICLLRGRLAAPPTPRNAKGIKPLQCLVLIFFLISSVFQWQEEDITLFVTININELSSPIKWQRLAD